MQKINLRYGRAHLVAKDIEECRNSLEGLIIAPYDPAKARGIGYNLSLSEMIYSITRKRLVPICREDQETFFYLHPNETVLALSHEHLIVDDSIAGSFHSRVRMAAQGIGSISTTLDPGWKGMLMFSINNPTKNKIKVILSKNSDGRVSTNAMITLVVWKTDNYDTNRGGVKRQLPLQLQLDNPPMRIDIWTELTVKRLRFFHDRYYQEFRRLVDALSSFENTPSLKVKWTDDLSRLLTDLRIVIEASKKEVELRKVLLEIKGYRNIPEVMKQRVESLIEVLNKNNILGYCRSKKYIKAIDLCEREIEYQLLCDQVSQVHKIIKENVPMSWHKTKLANIKHYFVINISLFWGTIVFVLILVAGRIIKYDGFWPRLLIAIAPLFLSIVMSYFKNKDGE